MLGIPATLDFATDTVSAAGNTYLRPGERARELTFEKVRCLPLTTDGWACRKSLRPPRRAVRHDYRERQGVARTLPRGRDAISRNLGVKTWQNPVREERARATLLCASRGSRQIIHATPGEPQMRGSASATATLLYGSLVDELRLAVSSLKNTCSVGWGRCARWCDSAFLVESESDIEAGGAQCTIENERVKLCAKIVPTLPCPATKRASALT